MHRRVADLCLNFSDYLKEGEKNFTGPPRYFHYKAMAIRNQFPSPSVDDLIVNGAFFDWIYATLTAWGMNRPGPETEVKTKLRELECIKKSFYSQKKQIEKLWELNLTSLPDTEVEITATALWEIVSSLKVSIANVRIVAGSKALHHFLPSLLPPIDGRYTLRFFYHWSDTKNEKERFLMMFPQFVRIAREAKKAIAAAVKKGKWNTSVTKTIDNAIVGWVLKNPQSK